MVKKTEKRRKKEEKKSENANGILNFPLGSHLAFKAPTARLSPLISGCCGTDTAHLPPLLCNSCCISLWVPVSSLLKSSLIALTPLFRPLRGRRGAGGANAPLPPTTPLTPCISSSCCLFDCVCTLHRGLVARIALVLAPCYTGVPLRGSVHPMKSNSFCNGIAIKKVFSYLSFFLFVLSFL